MIKILVPGNRNKIDCGFCGAVLSYDTEDIKENERFLGPRSSYFEKYIICPQCKYRIILEAQK